MRGRSSAGLCRPAGLGACRAGPAGAGGRACPLCREPPRGPAGLLSGGPGFPAPADPGSLPREVPELRPGSSPARPCEARLRGARVRDLYGRATHVVFPNLCVSAVLMFPETGVCCVKHKPEKPLTVSRCEQRVLYPQWRWEAGSSPEHPLGRAEPAGIALLSCCAMEAVSPRSACDHPSLTASPACAAQGWPAACGSSWDARAASYRGAEGLRVTYQDVVRATSQCWLCQRLQLFPWPQPIQGM